MFKLQNIQEGGNVVVKFRCRLNNQVAVEY